MKLSTCENLQITTLSKIAEISLKNSKQTCCLVLAFEIFVQNPFENLKTPFFPNMLMNFATPGWNLATDMMLLFNKDWSEFLFFKFFYFQFSLHIHGAKSKQAGRENCLHKNFTTQKEKICAMHVKLRWFKTQAGPRIGLLKVGHAGF